MRTHLHWIAAAVLVAAGLVCLILGATLVGNVLMAVACAVYAAGVALGPRLHGGAARRPR